MSGCGIFGLPFIFGTQLLEALQELRAERELENILVAEQGTVVPMTTSEGAVHHVSVLVTSETGVKVGFQRQKDGTLKAIADAGTAAARRQVLNRIRQRYAYHTVVDRLKQQGYTLVEEKPQADKSVRLVLRKWG